MIKLSEKLARASEMLRAQVDAGDVITLLDMSTLSQMLLYWSECAERLENPPVAEVVRLPVTLKVVGE